MLYSQTLRLFFVVSLCMAFTEEVVCEETIKMAFGNLARTYRDRNNDIVNNG